jgi:hypothetical protein
MLETCVVFLEAVAAATSTTGVCSQSIQCQISHDLCSGAASVEAV